MKKQKRVLLTSIIIVILIIISVFVSYIYLKISPDLQRLKEETYDTVFMSMYPIDNYQEEDYNIYRGMITVKCNYEMPNAKMMRFYMNQINKSPNIVSTVYLGIDPYKTNNEEVVSMIQENPAVMYEIILFHPQIQYWTDMNENQCDKVLNEYRAFYESVCGLPNARVYFFGEEWLVCNPLNYDKEHCTNVEVSLHLMCVSDYKHEYLLTQDNIQDTMDNMRKLISKYRDEPRTYADGSGYDIVFLGDSIFGNYVDSTSIPGVVSGLVDATTYNCSMDGLSATTVKGKELSANVTTDALITGDLTALPQEHHIYDDTYNFVNREDNKKVMFVINFGLNDYFEGCPLYGEDEYDEGCFEGAMRNIIKKIREAYPDAEIIVCTPNFTLHCDYGEGIQGENGGTLKDYADVIIKVAEDMDVEVLDNYNELPISEENWNELLSDGAHFNEKGRFLVGNRIAQRISEL